uniref:7TM_GPCR_Srx domain-containing protein n=1 Tax=Rhabditophanes sp. KR3021 TaxID=114890 RepID=A0AC35TPY0_9BILA
MIDDPSKKHPIYGTFLFIYSSTFFILDLICLAALLDNKLRHFNGIRIMTAISMCEVINIFPGGIIPGILAFKGHIYCSNVTLSYFHGQSTLLFYILTCCYAVLLSVNRCLAIAYPRLEARMFDGAKVFIWIGIILVYNVYFFFTTTTIFFGSKSAHFLYNPYFGYPFKDDGENQNSWQYYSNYITAFFVLFTYLTFAGFYLHVRKQTNKMSFSGQKTDCTKSIFASVFINAIILCFSNTTYNIIKDMEVNDVFYRISLVAAIAVEGMNSVVYYILNPTIRGIVQDFKIFKIMKFYKVAPVHKVTIVVSKNSVK